MSPNKAVNVAGHNNQQAELAAWAATHARVWWIAGLPWAVEGMILAPIAMPHQTPEEVPAAEVAAALAESGALLARWTNHWNQPEPTEWWYTVCDDAGYDLEGIDNSRGKRGIKKGLKECQVERIPSEDFAALAYPIYRQSLVSYDASATVPSEAAFAESVRLRAQFSGAEYWGAFSQADGRLAAYATCLVLGQAVSLGSTKADEALLGLNPNNALFYEVTRHYLRDRGMKYVSNGSRTLLHPTSINEFLERMGYRKCYARLNQVLSPKARLIAASRVAAWGPLLGLPKVLPKQWLMVKGFAESVRITQSFTR